MNIFYKANTRFYLALLLLFASFLSQGQNIAINTSGTAAAATNMLEVTQTSAAANMVAIYAINSGATAGTGYGLYSTKTGAGTVNIGGYFNASGGTANYPGIFMGGNVGIGTATPTNLLHIQGAGVPGIRLSTQVATADKTVSIDLLENEINGVRLFYEGLTGNELEINDFSTSGNLMTIERAGNVGIATVSPAAKLEIFDATQLSARLKFSGQEFYQAANTSTEGLSFLLGVNRANNRQLWIAESDKLTQNATNFALRLIPFSVANAGVIDYLSLDATTYNNIALTPFGGSVGVGTTAPNALLEVSKSSTDATVIQEVARLTTTGRTAGAGVNNRATLLSFYDASNPTLTAAVGGIREVPTGNYNGGLALYTNNTGAGNATAVTQLTERVRVTSGGNVGIGITTPRTKLHVASTGNTLANIKSAVANSGITVSSNYTAGADYAPGLAWTSEDNNPTITKASIFSQFTASGSYLHFGTSNNYGTGVTNDAMVIDYNGYVGVGITAPTSVLHVDAGGTNAGPWVTLQGGSGIFSNIGLRFWDPGTAAANENVIEFAHSTPVAVVARIKSVNPNVFANTGARLHFETASDNAGTFNTNQLVLNTDGKIGIGTSGPGAMLDISGGATQALLNLNGTFAPEFRMQNAGATKLEMGIATGADHYITGSVANDVIFRQTGGQKILFSSSAAGATNDLTLSGGNVGVGTTTPGEIVHVRKDQNNKTRLKIQNFTNGNTSGCAEFVAQRSNVGTTEIIAMGVGDAAYAGAGATSTDFRGAYIYSDCSQGISVRADAQGPIRFVTQNLVAGVWTATENMKVYSGGNVCINNGELWVSQRITSGTGGWGGGVCGSDIRFKKNISTLTNALDKVLALRGVNYFWRTDEFPDRHFNDEKQIGFIAQELEKVYPEVVRTEKDGYKAVDYSRLVPALVEAIKEQQKIINSQNDRINILEKSMAELIKASSAGTTAKKDK